MCSVEEEPKGSRELQKLQFMIRDLEEKNDLPSPEKSKISDSVQGNFPNIKDDVDENMLYNNNLKGDPYSENGADVMKEIEKEKLCEVSLLECGSESDDSEDIAIDEEDSWLSESPSKRKTRLKPKLWLTDDTKTPELNRVKGILASKLDLVTIQNRKETLNNLLARHNMGSHTESAPGRLYQAESMCSVMSLDWEYDQDELALSSPYGRAAMASDNYRMRDYDEIDWGRNGRMKQVSPYTSSPIRRRDQNRSLEDNQFEDLQPMNLRLDSPPTNQRSVQVAPGAFITRRGGPPGIGNTVKRSSFSDRSDSSGEFSTSPRSSLGSSRNSLESSEDVAIRKPKLRKGQRVLLPIASFFEAPISEEDLDYYDSSPEKMMNPYIAWDLMREAKTGIGRFPKNSSPSSTSGENRLQNESKLPSKPRMQQPIESDSVDTSLTVKLPAASSDGPVIRRRGAGSAVSMSMDSVPRQRQLNKDAMFTSQSPTSSNGLRSNMPRPRTSGSTGRRSAPAPRVSPRMENFQKPDIVPRRGRSPERKSRNPDVVPRKSGIIPRGQAVSRN